MAPAATALIVGAVIGGPAQTWIWLGAFLYDFALTYMSSRGGGEWHIGEAEAFGWFGAAALAAGIAVYVAATAVFARLVDLPWPAIRWRERSRSRHPYRSSRR